MNKPFRVSLKEKGRQFYWSPSEGSCLGYTIFTQKSVLWRGMFNTEVYIYVFLLYQELPIIMKKDIPENDKHGFSTCKIAGSGGMGMELREVFTLIFNLKYFF